MRALLLLAFACQSPRPVTMPSATPTPLDIPAAALPPGGMLMIGDLHGTQEIPAFVGRLVASVRQPVVLALEIPRRYAAAVDAFLASDGSPAMRQRLVTSEWWQAPFQDGRRSVAAADLLESVRAMRAGGRTLEVELIDDDTKPDSEGREEAMARNVIAVRRAHPDATVIVYAGNLHTSIREVGFKPGFRWMAMRVADAGIPFVSLNARYADGTAWMCRDAVAEHCGVGFLAGATDARGFHLEPTPGQYHGWFGVGSVTASPPAGFPELVASIHARIAAASRSSGAVEAKARRAYADKAYDTCAGLLAQIAEPDAGVAYDHACCLALSGRKDEALEKLRQALDAGFRDLAHAETDPDLASLRDDPRWPIQR